MKTGRIKSWIAALLLCVTAGLSGCSGHTSVSVKEKGMKTTGTENYYNKSTRIKDVINDPAFGDYSRLIFPVNKGYYSGSTLGDLQLTWYSDIKPDKTVEIANYFKSHAEAGDKIFYDIYSDEEKTTDPDKKNTGFFFFRGKPGAKTAIVNAGGGFVYVGAMQDSFPVSLELAKKGYNVAALIYRPGAQTACEDLARTIAFLYDHADEMNIDMSDYSLWGGSAGARMAAWLGSLGTESFGEKKYPRPAAVIMQYTGLSEVYGNEPPTYNCVGTNDGIAPWQTMEARIKAIKKNGTDAEIEVFKGLSHGFGLGEGTVAEGWVDHAATFWEKHQTHKGGKKTQNTVEIPDSIQAIPKSYFKKSDKQGKLVDLSYKTWESFSYEKKSTPLTKHAIIYLPYGYDSSKKYDIFYLMHGGWSDYTTALGTPDSPTEFKNVLDHSIANHDIKPLIVVCPTYNNTNEEGLDSNNYSLAMQLTDRYHNELLNDLMPAVEGSYSTYAEETSPNGFKKSRSHRGFGGFSMGSVTTWHTFQYDLDYFRYFLPMSCGTSLGDDSIWSAAKGRKQSDYFVFVMTGTADFALSFDESRTEKMASSDYFTDIDKDPSGNMAFRVKKGYSHDNTAAMEYTWNGIKAFFHQ